MTTNSTVTNTTVLKKRGLKSGMTMIETLGSLLIMAVMIVGAVILIRMAMDSSKLSDAQKSLTAMSIQIRGQFSGVGDFTGLSNALAIKAGLVPPRILRGNSILSPWGGAITLAAGTNATFTMTWGGLSDQVCIAMATYQPDLWQSISINGTALTTATAISQANTLCTGNANTVVYTDR